MTGPIVASRVSALSGTLRHSGAMRCAAILCLLSAGVSTSALADDLVPVRASAATAANPRVVSDARRMAVMRTVAAVRARGVSITTYETGPQDAEAWILVREQRGRPAETILRGRGLVYPGCLDISPKADRVALGLWKDGRRAVHVLELRGGELRELVGRPADAAPSELWIPCEVVFSPDGRSLAVGVQRAQGARVAPAYVQVHDVESGARVASIEHPSGLVPVSWSAAGLLLSSDAVPEQWFRWKPRKP